MRARLASRGRFGSMKRPFQTVDVFTDRKFGGNPLAVVTDAEGLDHGADAGHRGRVQPRRDDLRAAAARTRPTPPTSASSRPRPRCPSPAIPMSGRPSCWRAWAKASRAIRSCSRRRPGWCRWISAARTAWSSAARLAAPQPLSIGEEIDIELHRRGLHGAGVRHPDDGPGPVSRRAARTLVFVELASRAVLKPPRPRPTASRAASRSTAPSAFTSTSRPGKTTGTYSAACSLP